MNGMFLFCCDVNNFEQHSTDSSNNGRGSGAIALHSADADLANFVDPLARTAVELGVG